MQSLHYATKSSSAHDCAVALLDSLPAVMWFVRRHMRRHRTARISVPQFRILVALDRIPNASLCDIADNLGTTISTTSRIVSGLVRKGYIRRADSAADRRRVTLTITAKGRSVFQIARKDTQEAVALELADLSPRERRELIAVMATLAQVFEVPGGGR